MLKQWDPERQRYICDRAQRVQLPQSPEGQLISESVHSLAHALTASLTLSTASCAVGEREDP